MQHVPSESRFAISATLAFLLTLAARAASPTMDERANIPRSKLNSFIGGLAFFDAEGLRFHLAAYLIADLLGEYPFSLTFLLTHQPDRGNFELLDAAQRACVRAYLSLLLEEPDHEHDRDAIQGARWLLEQ